MIDLGSCFKIDHYKYEILFVADILSVSYAFFTSVLLSLIAIFSKKYLHREREFHRFYTLILLFIFGVNLVSFAGTIEIVIAGWEFVGLSSVLLISFFNYRSAPVKNAFYVFVNYRICDIGLCVAALLMHSTAQLGLIVTEIGFGFNALALLHAIGHSGFRALQILRAPSLLHDIRHLEIILGHHVKSPSEQKNKIFSYAYYRFILERGFLDLFFKSLLARILSVFSWIDKLEQNLKAKKNREDLRGDFPGDFFIFVPRLAAQRKRS